jgi:hypothetical protein
MPEPAEAFQTGMALHRRKIFANAKKFLRSQNPRETQEQTQTND